MIELPDKEVTPMQTMTLADGRRLAFSQWGSPDGFPAFYFHGTPGSRLEGAFADSAARRLGFRLIAVDRPGFGGSDFLPGRRFTDWPNDVLALAQHLGLREFGVVGHSGGGPHLFACGAFIDPARLKFIGALGPWGPSGSPEVRAQLNGLDRFFSGIASSSPWIMRAAFAPVGWLARHWPSAFFGMMESSVSPADKEALRNPSLARWFRASEREAFRQGGRGAAHEALICYRPWGFELQAVRVPTHIWQGDQDIFVPVAMARVVERSVPDVDFNWVAGKGHLNIEDWQNILAACARDRPDLALPSAQDVRSDPPA